MGERETPTGRDLLSRMLDDAADRRGSGVPTEARREVQSLVEQVLDPGLVAGKDVRREIERRIAALDLVVGRQLDRVLQHPDFQRLEASWRGLHRLVMGCETGEMLRIRVLGVAKRELQREHGALAELAEAAARDELPLGAIALDCEFSRSPEDVALLARLARLAARAHAPVIAAAAPAMFGLESFRELPELKDLARAFEGGEGDLGWRSLREAPEARFLMLVLPRVLRRLPYDSSSEPVEELDYCERVSSDAGYLWGNAVYDRARTIAAAFAAHGGWPGISGPEGGGLVADLPVHVARSPDGEVSARAPTEASIDERTEYELASLGFAPLLHVPSTDYAAFFSEATVGRPELRDERREDLAERLSCRLSCVLALSRAAHHVRAVCRDHPEILESREALESQLRRSLTGVDDVAAVERPKRAGGYAVLLHVQLVDSAEVPPLPVVVEVGPR